MPVTIASTTKNEDITLFSDTWQFDLLELKLYAWLVENGSVISSKSLIYVHIHRPFADDLDYKILTVSWPTMKRMVEIGATLIIVEHKSEGF